MLIVNEKEQTRKVKAMHQPILVTPNSNPTKVKFIPKLTLYHLHLPLPFSLLKSLLKTSEKYRLPKKSIN